MKLFRLLLGLLVVPAVQAEEIYLNSPLVFLNGIQATVAGAKYRMSATNFDQSLDRGVGTATSADFISANLGNLTALNASTFTFTLQHVPVDPANAAFTGGFIFTISGSGSVTQTYRLAWGTFATPPAGPNTTVTALLNGIAPTGNFNWIALLARNGTSTATLNITNLNFTGPGLTVADGAWADMHPAAQATGSQWLFAPGGLRDSAWTLSGNIQSTRDPGSDELVRFTIALQQADAFLAPEPSSFALAGLALLGIGALSRRR